jgi:hypothetical protein
MDTIRILAIIRSQRSTKLAASNKTPGTRREASIWNVVTCIAKGKHEQAPLHAPKLSRDHYVKLAKKRYNSLSKWANRHKVQAATLCAPLIAEYEQRAKRRALLASA